MAIKTKAQLKEYFKTGKRPKQSDFEDLIDSLVTITEIPERPYKVFCGLLSTGINNSLETIVLENTIGNLDIRFESNTVIYIEDLSGKELLTYDKRVVFLGPIRYDYNFSSILEYDESTPSVVSLIITLKPTATEPSFHLLPIEIRVYN